MKIRVQNLLVALAWLALSTLNLIEPTRSQFMKHLKRIVFFLCCSATFAQAVPWTATGPLLTGRAYHTATLLSNGKVLAAGGVVVTNLFTTVMLSSAELYDPVAGTWSSAGLMTTGRVYHTATLLASGKVLVTGGSNGTNVLASAELYDPLAGTWTLTGSMNTRRFNHAATLLPNGMVLVTGGNNGSVTLSSAELYDPGSETWTAAHSLGTARYSHTATLLQDGTVLVAGGGNSTVALTGAERYQPISNTWTSAGAMATSRQEHTATLLRDGRVLVAGGSQIISSTATAELYDPNANTWTTTGSLATDRADHTATLRPDGRVLVAGGFQAGFNTIPLSSVEVFDPTAGTWAASDSMNNTRYGHTATLLTNGEVMVAAGQNSIFNYLTNAERQSLPAFYDFGAGLPGTYNHSAPWGDFNNDSRLDIVIPNGVDFYPLWVNTGNGFTNEPSDLNFYVTAWGDFDNDGRLDTLIDYGGLYSGVWRSTGNSFSNLNSGLPVSFFGSVAWGDYDNDGRPDVLQSGYTYVVKFDSFGAYLAAQTNSTILWRNTSDGFVSIHAGPPGVYYGTVAWGDYDGDGRLDILVTGVDSTRKPITQVWRNTGHGFTNINAGLPGVAYGSAAWGDYDNDGRPDILLTGATNLNHPGTASDFDLGPFETYDTSTPVSGNPAGYVTQIWRNTGSGFSNINAALPGVWAGSATWGDYDNDGRLDILLVGATSSFVVVTHNPDFSNSTNYQAFASGFISQICRNTGAGFTNINAGLPGVGYSSAAWGDFDNDGRLDLLLAGATAVDGSGNVTASISQVWRNHATTNANSPPAAPTGLGAIPSGNSVVFSWNAVSDAQTPSAGLSYNLRVGTTPGGGDLVNPMADSGGQRRVVQAGNAQQRLAYTVTGLPAGQPLYWSVQAIDTAFAGSAFAMEQTFAYNTVLTPPNGVPVPGDLNGDGIVSQSELDAVLSYYWPYSPWIYMTNVAGLGGTNVTFALTNSTAGAFSVEYTTNLTDWYFLGPATPRYEFTDTNAPALPRRYYRLRWP